jgi:hypothetical protein
MPIICGFALGVLLLPTLKVRASGDSIESIRAHYASINKNIKRYRKVEKDADGYSTEGGTITAYFDGDSIKKIAGHFYGEIGRADEDYYYWDDQLIFVFRKESTYDRPLSGKVVATKESRFYFENGRMIRWLNEKGRQVPPSSSGYREKQSEYLDSAKKFGELARS